MTETTVLLRQIHPSFVQNGRPTSQAFRPTPKDENQLSVYDGDQIAADVAWEHYTSSLELASVGVFGLSVAECTEQSLEVKPDPAPFPEHVLIDFSAFSPREIEKKSKLLKSKAEARGLLYGSL
jgi:hypothetical protein